MTARSVNRVKYPFSLPAIDGGFADIEVLCRFLDGHKFLSHISSISQNDIKCNRKIPIQETALTTCALCNASPVSTAWRDKKQSRLIVVCPTCEAVVKAATYLRNEEHVVYAIESGWESNPVWYCDVVLDAAEKTTHLHTTKDAGEAPTVFNGETSGLYFQAKGGLWPIESREGRLLHVVWKNDQKATQAISTEGDYHAQ